LPGPALASPSSAAPSHPPSITSRLFRVLDESLWPSWVARVLPPLRAYARAANAGDHKAVSSAVAALLSLPGEHLQRQRGGRRRALRMLRSQLAGRSHSSLEGPAASVDDEASASVEESSSLLSRARRAARLVSDGFLRKGAAALL
jgi:hypothetical protein